MLEFRFTIFTPIRKELEKKLKSAEQLGDLRLVKRIMALLAVADGQSVKTAANVLKVTAKSVVDWVRSFLIYGMAGLQRRKSPGRPPKLTKRQKQELAEIIEAGPAAAGFSAGCWRSPMVQHLINEKYGVFYNVHYIAQLLKDLGFSFQKARFISDRQDDIARWKWRKQTFPEIVRQAKQKNGLILFGDEASFPQWGTLSYTWARRGRQPLVKTSGKRKGYKVFGLIDYFTGRFFHYGLEGKLNSASYQDFLTKVIAAASEHIFLIQDGAKYHTSAAMKQFFAHHSSRLTVFQLPTYSPDFNPIEKLWKNIKRNRSRGHIALFMLKSYKILYDLIKIYSAIMLIL